MKWFEKISDEGGERGGRGGVGEGEREGDKIDLIDWKMYNENPKEEGGTFCIIVFKKLVWVI